jgi:hypothetical protein
MPKPRGVRCAHSSPPALPWRLQVTDQPANISGFRRIQGDSDLFDVIALGAIECPKFKACRSWRDARKHHGCPAFRAMKSLKRKQRDCGEIIGHGLPPLWDRRERKALSRR